MVSKRRSCPEKAHKVGECGERRRPLLPHWAINCRHGIGIDFILLVDNLWIICGIFVNVNRELSNQLIFDSYSRYIVQYCRLKLKSIQSRDNM